MDTARYATFYCGVGQRGGGIGARGAELNDNTASLYRTSAQPNTMLIEVPVAQGMDVYVFRGGSIDEIVAAYNLFSGGGCMPPLWGLGTFYRCYLKYDSRRVREMASYFRREGLPLTILGLEPGWQDHSYSCSYVWDRERYPDHRELMRELREQGFHLSLIHISYLPLLPEKASLFRSYPTDYHALPIPNHFSLFLTGKTASDSSEAVSLSSWKEHQVPFPCEHPSSNNSSPYRPDICFS